MAVDQRIREDQAGFRAEIDFRNDLDSIYRDTLWSEMRHYGLPQKIVSLIKLFYERFECSVILSEGVSDFFQVQTGVSQGCMLSPLLFLILIDNLMRIANERSRGGIRCSISSGRVEYLDRKKYQKEDLEYIDDLAVSACTRLQIPKRYGKLRGVCG